MKISFTEIDGNGNKKPMVEFFLKFTIVIIEEIKKDHKLYI